MDLKQSPTVLQKLFHEQSGDILLPLFASAQGSYSGPSLTCFSLSKGM